MPKKIPTNFDVDDPRSYIRKVQRREMPHEKGSGGIKNETKEYKKELRAKKGKSHGKSKR